MKVYEVVARAIVDEQVEAAFVLLGNANMEMVSTLADLGGPELYHTRIEGTAVGMAEGFARSTDKLGLAIVTSGPALANTVNAMTSAARAGTPLVVFTGHPERGHHQSLHQEALAELAGARYFDVPSAGATLDVIRAAFYTARAEQVPVVLDVSRAVQAQDYVWDYAYRPSFEDLVPAQRLHPDPAALSAAVDLIAASERPVVIAGVGAQRSGARAEILAFAAEGGALLSTSLLAKNWFSGEPFDLGIAGLYAWSYAAEVFAQADCIIGIGASLNHFTIESGYLSPTASIVQIDTKPELLIGTGQRADAYVQGDAKVVTALLTEQLRQRGAGGSRFRSEQLQRALVTGAENPDPVEFDIEPDRADVRKLIRVVDAEVPADYGVVVAGGHSGGIAHMTMRTRREPQLFSHAFGSIGIAFPLALGMAVGGRGRPVVHLEGDGSIMMTVHGFDTLARYNLPVLVVVFNDSSYSSEVHQLIAQGLNENVGHLSDVDFAAVAASFGCRSAVVRSESDMREAIKQFTTDPGPFVVDARLSREVVSVAFRRRHYGREA